MQFISIRSVVLAVCLSVPMSFAHAADTSDTASLTRCCNGDQSTYQAFGEKAGIERLLQSFMKGLLADARTRPFFENQNHERIIARLTDQVCFALEGPCQYSGRGMSETHKNMGIKREEFNALVEVLQRAMDQAGIPFRSQNKLLAVFAPMERDIVTR